LIILSANAIIFLASKGFEVIGVPQWFTINLDRIDLGIALINASIFGIDTLGKLFTAAFRGIQE